MTFNLAADHDTSRDQVNLQLLPSQCDSAVDFTGISIPKHLTKELLSYFPKASGTEAYALDLGCGAGVHRDVCEHAGFNYIGLDYSNAQAPLLGDAHALPFADETFDFILSIAVFEHIQYPFVAIREVARVLKPGGVFLGTVAFLEPYHGHSYYHHSHLGVLNLLRFGGLDVTHVAPSSSWNVVRAQSKVLFPRMPRKLVRSAARLTTALDRLWCRFQLSRSKITSADFDEYLLTTSGAFKFVAYKSGNGVSE